MPPPPGQGGEIGGDPRLAPERRHAFVHAGATIYEWEQTLAEVNVYVPVPPGVRGRDLDVLVERARLRFGLRGNPPFLDGALHAPVAARDCLWTLEDGVLHVTLSKADPGEAWPRVVQGHAELTQEERDADAKRLLLERFQHEHPGFDFSGATVSGGVGEGGDGGGGGGVPDARTFLGGIGGSGGG
jgi:HSP20 family molecular chaperone IbpA